MDEKEAEKTSKEIVDIFDKTANICAESFEKWCREHKESTKEEAHERLVKEVRGAIVTANLLAMMMANK